MAISFTALGTNSSSGSGQISVTVTAAAPAGVVLVAGGAFNTTAGATAAFSDSTGNAWVNATGNINNNNSSTNGCGALGYSDNTAHALVSGSSTVSVDFTSGVGVAIISVMYVTGLLTPASFDTAVTATAFGNSAAPSVTSGIPTASGEALCGWSGSKSGGTFTPNGAWPAPLNALTFSTTTAGGGSQVNATGSAQTFSGTITSAAWSAMVLGFKSAAVLNIPAFAQIGTSISHRLALVGY